MSKSFKTILKEAKKAHKLEPRKKLTQIQNELSIKEGYKSFLHLKSQQQAREKEERLRFAKSRSISEKVPLKEIHRGIAIYVREDGRRGITALKEFKKGQPLFVEKPFLYALFSEDIYDEGLAWRLTRNIATKFPDAVHQLEVIGELRESFRPKLSKNDKMILADIAKISKNTVEHINKIYNLVCTYNTEVDFRYFDGFETVVVMKRICISAGLANANHSCIPNSTRLHIASPEDFIRNIEGLIALQDIAKGEEITWNYLGDTLPAKFTARRKILERKFDFVCTCDKCIEDKRQIRTK